MSSHEPRSASESEPVDEEFDPVGTLALILAYFAILVVMWVYIYFVEFLGNELTVIGRIAVGG